MTSRLQRLETVQSILLEIGQKSSACSDLTGFLQAVHVALGRLMYSANFYVALNDPATTLVRFVYYVDEADPTPDPKEEFSLPPPESSPTAWVILNRKMLVENRQQAALRQRSAWYGTQAEHWMGCPLLDQHQQPLGAIVIQSYSPDYLFSSEDQALFKVISHHVSFALQSIQGIERLEAAVKERTVLLETEITERRYAEALQRALYEIAELSNTVDDVDKLYASVHQSIAKLMVAKNFMIARYHPESNEISMQYFIDEIDEIPVFGRFPMGLGMTSFVIRSRHAQLIDRPRLKELIASGDIQQVLGNIDTYSWMGAPMMAQEQLYGVIIIQSYQAEILYSEAELNLLAFVASHVATAIARFDADSALRTTKQDLVLQNTALNQAMLKLQQAQKELVRQEKMASLGGLVAGIAHEINTPLGICVTAASHLEEELRLTREDLQNGVLNQEGLLAFFDTLDQTIQILSSNTSRAANLIRSFKQVAVDQASEELREFNLHHYLHEILQSLQPKFKGRNITITIDCATSIMVVNYPGALSQVLTNMLMNSLIHGFENNSKGKIHISAKVENLQICLDYTDDGVGMDQEAMGKLFDPFYTTKRGQGGSGLGAHIIYNIVTGPLGGSIQAISQPGSGLTYRLTFPQQRAPLN